MIRRMQRNYHSVGMVIETQPEESNPFCNKCSAVDIISRLKERLYLDDKGKMIFPLPPNANEYLQCRKCGQIVQKIDAKMLGTI